MALDNGNNNTNNITYSVKRSKMVLKSGPPPGRIHSIKTNEPVIPRIRTTRMTARTPLTITGVRRPATLVVHLIEDFYSDDSSSEDGELVERNGAITNLGSMPLGKEMALTGIQEPLMLGKRF